MAEINRNDWSALVAAEYGSYTVSVFTRVLFSFSNDMDNAGPTSAAPRPKMKSFLKRFSAQPKLRPKSVRRDYFRVDECLQRLVAWAAWLLFG